MNGTSDDWLYFDCAATTKIKPEVLEAMMPYLTHYYGNASSHYSLGRFSKQAIDNAREIIASVINARPDEIYFTSGGSESNNWAIKGLKNRYRVSPMHMITTNIEHHSITEAMKNRKAIYNDTVYTCVPVEDIGVVSPAKVIDTFRMNTRLCSIQHVNNELGTIQPIEQIAYKCYDNGIIFHTDAVQSFGHLPIDVQNNNINVLSASGHKLGAMKGIGFLYISNDYKSQYMPFINGGQQERGMRASTENVAGIVGLGKAAEIAMQDMQKIEDIRSRTIMLESALKNITGVKINAPIEMTDYRHINFRVAGIQSEELMMLLDSQGICVSAGSACNSDSEKPSHVLKAIGLEDEEANSSIRISLGVDNTQDEINALIDYLKYDIELLRHKGE